MPSISDEIILSLRAGLGGLRVVTRDEEALIKETKAPLVGDGERKVYIWSCASGLWQQFETSTRAIDDSLRDPFDFLFGMRRRLKDENEPCLFFMMGADFIIEKEPVLRRAFIEAVRVARSKGHLLLLVGRNENIHAEIHDEISTVRHALPSREDSEKTLKDMLATYKMEGDLDAILDAAAGLTASRQQDAFGVAIIEATEQQGAVDPLVVKSYKEREVGKKAQLTIKEPKIGFKDLIGHEYAKAYLGERKATLTEAARQAGIDSSKGVLFVGPPGTGKSRIAEAIAKEWGTPFLLLDTAGLYGSLLGESETRLAEALEIAERMAPCVLLIDEVERGFSAGSGDRDGGTQERILGKMLTWMASKTAPVFVVMTSNFADRLPAALIRKGRIDEIFCMGFPTAEERRAVFDLYLDKADPHLVQENDINQLVHATEGWVPSEIEAIVNAARITAFAAQRPVQTFDLVNEVSRTVPVSVSMRAQVEQMLEWASEYARRTDYSDAPEMEADDTRIIRA